MRVVEVTEPRRGRREHPRYSGARTRGAVVVVFVLGLLVALALPARADENEPKQSNMLVLQSISLIANRAPTDQVAEKIQDALNAPDKSGTDEAKVRQAQSLAREGATTTELAQARDLLTAAIDIRVASGYGQVPEPGKVSSDTPPYATGAETGTTVVLDELEPRRGVSDWGDAVLTVLAGLAIVLGIVLERRWRPHETIRQLRHQPEKPAGV